MTIIGEIVMKAREDRGWSQMDLANKAGMNQATISRIEGGKATPNYQSIKSLSIVLEIDIARLTEARAELRKDQRRTRDSKNSLQGEFQNKLRPANNIGLDPDNETGLAISATIEPTEDISNSHLSNYNDIKRVLEVTESKNAGHLQSSESKRPEPSPVPWNNPSLSALFRHEPKTVDATTSEDPPEWDLGSLYSEPAEPQILKDLEALDFECRTFELNYKGRLTSMDASGLLRSMLTFEKIEAISGRIASYLSLRHYADRNNLAYSAAFFDGLAQVTSVTERLVFYAVELCRISTACLESMYSESPDLAKYRPVFEQLITIRKFILSEQEELGFFKRSLEYHKFSNRHDRVMAEIKVQVTRGSESLSVGVQDALWLGGGGSINRESRREAVVRLGEELAKKNHELTEIYTSQIAVGTDESRRRGHRTSTSSQHMADLINPKIVNVMEGAVGRWVPKVAHRYFKLRANWLGVDQLFSWDTHAPLPLGEEELIGWRDASRMVQTTIEDFSPAFGSVSKDFLTRGWIDAKPRPGKEGVAFCHPTVSDANPFIQMNFFRGERDALTLASMLGYGIHQYLASAQGELVSTSPLTLASTASQFFETLVATRMLEGATSNQVRKRILARMVEDRLANIVRQALFYRFEIFAHDGEHKGRKRSSDELNEAWVNMERTYYGPVFEPAEGTQYHWSRIGHFMHSPFHTYTYAFGGLVAISLFAVFLEEVSLGREGFADRLYFFLAAGRSKTPEELLGLFGLDISQLGFWDGGLNVLSRMLDELERL
jgi:oligoendopeptidase F